MPKQRQYGSPRKLFHVPAVLMLVIIVDIQEGAILVFLPGWGDISEVNKILKRLVSPESVKIIPLHSLISTKEQRTVFKRPPSGVRKIVLSTNIAETRCVI